MFSMFVFVSMLSMCFMFSLVLVRLVLFHMFEFVSMFCTCLYSLVFVGKYVVIMFSIVDGFCMF